MPPLAGIAVAVAPDRVHEVSQWNFPLPLWVVTGGATRQTSVEAALGALPEGAETTVLIHDAVRPFPPAAAILALIRALETWDGAVLGEASADTLKEVDALGRIVATLPRERIFRAQTPQVARLGTWKRAFDWARSTGFIATDDVALLEAMGCRVLLVPSPASNLKITTPEDWARATDCGR